MSNTEQNRVILTAVPTVTKTASFVTPAMDVSQVMNYINVEVVSSAVTGTTPSLTFTTQWSYDGGTSWSSNDGAAETWTAITANGQSVKQFTPKGPMMRLNGVITGTTPSFTVKVNLFIV